MNTFGGFRCECHSGFGHVDDDFHSCIGITAECSIKYKSREDKYRCLLASCSGFDTTDCLVDLPSFANTMNLVTYDIE